jgi:hypothetical protein
LGLSYDKEIQQLKSCIKKLENRHLTGLKSGEENFDVITARWERDYLALYREFEDFQSAMLMLIQSETNAGAEKV